MFEEKLKSLKIIKKNSIEYKLTINQLEYIKTLISPFKQSLNTKNKCTDENLSSQSKLLKTPVNDSNIDYS